MRLEEDGGEPPSSLLPNALESRSLSIRECDDTQTPLECFAILPPTDTEPAFVEEGTTHAYPLFSTGVPSTLEDVLVFVLG